MRKKIYMFLIKRLFKNRSEILKYIFNGEEWNSVLNALYVKTGVPTGDNIEVNNRIKKCCTKIANEMTNPNHESNS